jgi:hypothetical protein
MVGRIGESREGHAELQPFLGVCSDKHDRDRGGSAERCSLSIISFCSMNKRIPFSLVVNNGVMLQKVSDCYYF